MVNVTGGPGHTVVPFVNVGVMDMVAVTGEVPGFVAVKEGRFPVPEAARPILILLFVQAYVVVPPVFTVVNVTADVAEPLHTNISAGLLTCPAGLYTTVTSSLVLQKTPFLRVHLSTYEP